MTSRQLARSFFAAWLAGALCAACTPGGPTPADGPTRALSATAPNGQRLLDVSLPDLSRMDESARAQINGQYAALTAAAGDRRSAEPLARAYGDMGRLLMAVEYLDAAEPFLLNALTLSPGDMRWPYYLAHLYRQNTDLEQATAYFEKALAGRPDDPLTLLWLGSMYLDRGQNEQASSMFARVLSREPQSVAALFGAGKIALAQREFPRAIALLQKGLALDPKGTVMHYPLAMAYRGAGDAARADAHLRLRGDVSVDPPDPLMRELEALVQTPQALENRGFRAINQGNWTDAAVLFRQAAALAPENSSIRLNLGTALLQSGDGQGALREYQEAIRLSPQSARPHYSLGLLLELAGRDREAIDQFTIAARDDPSLLDVRVTLADALRRNSRLEEALVQYRAVIAADPTVADPWFGEALALMRLGRYGQALERLTEATTMFPDDRRFSHAMARLLAAAPAEDVRDGNRAMAVVQTLLAADPTIDLAATHAMALAELGRFDQAVRVQREALAAARRSKGAPKPVLEQMALNLARYQRGQPCRIPWADADPIHGPGPQVEPDLLGAASR